MKPIQRNAADGAEQHAIVPVSGEVTRVAAAAAIGMTMEFYDFILYNVAAALVFNKLFFGSVDPLVGTLAAYVTFFLGFCARPLGGLIFGHFGDRVGRRGMLLLTASIMGVATVLIGLMPTYAQIGIWAPIGLLVLRLLQGFGLGGEYGGGMVLMVEHAPPSRRGFYSALVHIGTPAGFLLPIAIIGILDSHMSPDAFLEWGWRVPFLGSAVLVAVALFIRFRVSESPAFRHMIAQSPPARVPALEAIRKHWRQIVLGIIAKNAESGLFNVYAVFSITYAVNELHLPRSLILNGILVACTVECATLPVFGMLSDRIGRKPVYVAGALFQAALAIAYFAMLDTANPAIIWAAVALGFGIGHGAMYGAQGAFFSELFPARTRYSGLSLVQQIGPILGGGLSPLIATLLLVSFHATWAVSGYMIAIAIASAAAAMALRPRFGVSEAL